MSRSEIVGKDEMIKLATKYQQSYYELLPDWFEYYMEDYQYLKQNIGFALFGPPQTEQEEDYISDFTVIYTTNEDQSSDAIAGIKCARKAEESIGAIYEKILTYGSRSEGDPIYVGIIYNIIFPKKVSNKSSSNANKPCEDTNEMYVLPVFKIRKYLKATYGGSSHYTVWYIDNNARVYKSWMDYTRQNTLPKCTMVLPYLGLYQYDPRYKVTEICSTVWVEVLDSPACATKMKVLNALDTTTNVLGIGAAVGLGVASFLTPVGPALTAVGLASSGISGLWTIGRRSQQLVNRVEHEESVSLRNKDARIAWLGIAGSAFGIGTTGGTVLLSKAVAKGATISAVTKIAYSSVVLGTLTVNGIGVLYQGYCLINKYHKQQEIDVADVVLFMSHILFFGNVVSQTKLAYELVTSSRGSILERFKNDLRFTRLRKEFNRMKKNTDNTCSKNEREGLDVIRQIKKHSNNIISIGRFTAGLFNVVNDQLKTADIPLLHPDLFLKRLMSASKSESNFEEPHLKVVHKSRNDEMRNLTSILKELLAQFIARNAGFSSKELSDFNHFLNILEDIRCAESAPEVLVKVFNIAETLIKCYNEPEMFLVKAVQFIWKYVRANLGQSYVNSFLCCTNTRAYEVIIKIVRVMYDNIEYLTGDLQNAFYIYTLNS